MSDDSDPVAEEVQKEELYEARHSRFLAKEEERRQGLQLLTDIGNRRLITKYSGVTPNKYRGFQALIHNDMLNAMLAVPEVDWDALESACKKPDGEIDWTKMLAMVRQSKAENGGAKMDWISYEVLEFIEDATMSQDGWRAKQIENMSSVGAAPTHRASWWSALFGGRKK